MTITITTQIGSQNQAAIEATPPIDGAYELEDGSGYYELEDGSGIYLLE